MSISQLPLSQELNKDMFHIMRRQRKEMSALNTCTAEILQKLNLTVECLPDKCQKLILDMVKYHKMYGLQKLDPTVVRRIQCKLSCEEMEDEYEILKLNQKNIELQNIIDQNKTKMAAHKRGVQQVKQSLGNQTPNPDKIKEEIRLLKLKVASYEESYAKINARIEAVKAPPEIYPKYLDMMTAQLASLREEELMLKKQAEDIMHAQSFRSKLNRLKL